ncbi:hypothetical protein EDF39_3286 [Frondihabitans sp. PhB161]|nr:hypothetical protein EDF37_3218 [Frondihabitans sp. PhB153]RPF02903.1 hypothetical protein EDF39_3286 [Frondihabitans sp. PhB161]
MSMVMVVHYPISLSACSDVRVPGNRESARFVTAQDPAGRILRFSPGARYQLTGSALPSSYPAADWMPTSARSENSARVRAPA